MKNQIKFKAIGTSWVIDIPNSFMNEEEITMVIKKRIDEFDKTYSRFREDSLVSEISRMAGVYNFPTDSGHMLNLYRKLYVITDGLMTPLIGQALVDTGYDNKYSLLPKKEIREVRKWDNVMNYFDFTLETKEPVILDFGAMGKGYLIDIISEILQQNNIFNYTINAGGDIAYKNTGGKKLRVGLENPSDFNEAVGVAEILDESICGSSGSRRAWGKYHHIINPETIESPGHILALWVVAKTTLLADALATALFFVSPEKLIEKYNFEYAIINKDNSVLVSKNFPGSFFV